MQSILRTIATLIDGISESLGRAVSWLTTVLVIIFCYDVIMRYLFNNTAVWITELEWHLFSLIFLLGAAFAYRHDKHVRVDVFYTKFSAKGKAWVNLIGILVFLIPWCLVVIRASYRYANYSLKLMEGSPNPGGLPYRFIIKFSITVGIVLLLLQAISELCKALISLTSKTPNTNPSAQ